jgi:ribosomal protein L37AE/L43A
MTNKEKRDVYYIYRAMHDSVCPNCGSTRVDDVVNGDISCRRCGFTITAIEATAIEGIGVEAIKGRLDTFQRVRSQLTSRKEKSFIGHSPEEVI